MHRSWMRFTRRAAVAGVLALVAGCAAGTTREEPAPVAAREVPDVVARMIEAHGGMQAWAAAPTVRFTERWGDGPATTVTVEQGARRAYQEIAGTNARMAWDGERAWGVEWKGAPPRFAARLNYYFLNLPWLTMDPGVMLGEPGIGRVFDDTTSYKTVMMTFEPGTGDTPDDSFELYIHPVTHRLAACRYVMTYRAVLPPGVERAPDHMLVFEEHATVNGLVVPVRYTIHGMDRSVLAACTISDWAFDRPFDAAMVAMPAGAVVDTTRP